MSESPVEGENAASSASATQKRPNTASSVDATAPSVSYRPVVSDCRAADSRNFEENSNRDWLQAARKTPPKATCRPPQGRIQVPSFAELRSGRLLRLKWRAIRATLSLKGSTVSVLQALLVCVVSEVRSALIIHLWKPIWLSGDGKRGASLFGCSISGASGRRCCQTQGE